jgi:hypothetical protein
MEQILSIDEIKIHELNPNKMERKDMDKLKALIKQEQNYPPLVVNLREGEYKLIDGHQRLQILKELGYKEIKCDIWKVDAKTELILLSTLNKLRGKSVGEKKKTLYKELSKHLEVKQIRAISPEKKDFFNDLFNRVSETKDKVKQSLENKKLIFMQRLSREEYDFVMEFIRKELKPEFHEQAIYHIIKKYGKTQK